MHVEKLAYTLYDARSQHHSTSIPSTSDGYIHAAPSGSRRKIVVIIVAVVFATKHGISPKDTMSTHRYVRYVTALPPQCHFVREKRVLLDSPTTLSAASESTPSPAPAHPANTNTAPRRASALKCPRQTTRVVVMLRHAVPVRGLCRLALGSACGRADGLVGPGGRLRRCGVPGPGWGEAGALGLSCLRAARRRGAARARPNDESASQVPGKPSCHLVRQRNS